MGFCSIQTLRVWTWRGGCQGRRGLFARGGWGKGVQGGQAKGLHVLLEVELQPRAQQHHLVAVLREVQLAVLLRRDAHERRPRKCIAVPALVHLPRAKRTVDFVMVTQPPKCLSPGAIRKVHVHLSATAESVQKA
jgi:hypothetical protein